MSNAPYIRAAIAQVALELAPPLIRKSLLDEPSFRQEYGLRTELLLSLGDSGVSIHGSEIFGAVRAVLGGAAELDVIDVEGREWKLRGEPDTGQPPKLILLSGGQRLLLPDFAVLSPDAATRLRSLDEVGLEMNLPSSRHDRWREILVARAFEDEEVDAFHSDVRDTPVHMMQAIADEILAGRSRPSSFVPCSRTYFERLVGAYDESASVWDYASGAGRRFLEQLSAWRPYEGFLFSLFLSSHSALTAEISVESLECVDLARAYGFVERYGDVLSRLGAIEIGLRILPENPEIEPVLVRLIEHIRDDDVDGSRSGFKLLSALFVLVDGELARTRLMCTELPFYRRLASLAQAALICRQLVKADIQTDAFCEWAFSKRGEQYYMQSLADMRLEPRWNPDLAVASQMKADFFGRIVIAAKIYRENIRSSVLHDLILGTDAASIQSLSVIPYSYFPGPLEGTEDSPNVLPDDLSKAIEEQLNTNGAKPLSFVALVNSAMIFRIESDKAELAVNALKIGNYRLDQVQDKSQLLAILDGLAMVAAVARNAALADELRIVGRRYRHDPQYSLTVEEEVRTCLKAAASRSDLIDWTDFVGEWLTELAFGEFDDDEAGVFQSHLQCLCHAVPELWVSCGRADAALSALGSR